jgi:predicted DNA-binding protein
MATAKRWTHIRVPVELAERLTSLAGEMLIAHGEGRVTLPNSMVEYVPAYYVIVNALNEQQARRERSRRPRAKQSADTSPIDQSPATEIIR